jgi:hypothetical protein
MDRKVGLNGVGWIWRVLVLDLSSMFFYGYLCMVCGVLKWAWFRKVDIQSPALLEEGMIL